MNFIADLHIHSPFSRATSPESTLAGLAAWAQIKGIQILATGDFTHPGWFRRLREELEPAEPGLFRLRDVSRMPQVLPGVTPSGEVRFLLSAEISSIYKRHGATRKVHNLLYVPDFDSASRINARLAAVGNIESDGRPILGLDSRDLLEIVLACAPDGFLVPAHIWTPWFSLFGSRSGFDRIEECFGDLTDQIFALETGLSSDPEMNRLISGLDRFALISNSDCHSPSKIGREANLFTTGCDFFSLRDALKANRREHFAGTVEFFPEEGKYHADGHRACNVCLEPQQSRTLANRCPVCGQPLTIGVLHRVLELADRERPLFPSDAPAVHSLIPLPEVLGELLRVGPGAKEVQRRYAEVIGRFGSEFNLLLHAGLDEVTAFSPLLGEALRRMRSGEVIRRAGYDGEFGVIRVFAEGELDRLAGQGSLFGDAAPRRGRKKKVAAQPLIELPAVTPPAPAAAPGGPNPEQQVAIHASSRHVLVAAGPGSGKTHTLIERLVRLLRDGAEPATLWAITFTNRAADEVRSRLTARAGVDAEDVFVGTLHAFCLHWLRRSAPELTVIGPEERARLLRRLFPALGAAERRRLDAAIDATLGGEVDGAPPLPDEDVQRYLAEVQRLGALDLDSVVPALLERLRDDSAFDDELREEVLHLMVDEFQDLNAAQYALIKSLGQTCRIFAIGDPDQAIYGFRGSDPAFFFDFACQPETTRLQLVRNYRCADEIVAAAVALIGHNLRQGGAPLTAVAGRSGTIEYGVAPTPAAEAEFIVRRIEELVGGVENFSRHSGRGGSDAGRGHAFAEIAILVRMGRQMAEIAAALARRGIPCQQVGVTPFFMAPALRGATRLVQLAAGAGEVGDWLLFLRELPGCGAATLERLETLLPLSGDFAAQLRTVELTAPITRLLEEWLHQLPLFIAQARQFGIVTALDGLLPALGIDPAAAETRRLLELAGSFGRDLAAFGAHLRRHAEATIYDERAEAVALMTLHAAKGLEFPVVFLAGMEEGLLPATLSGSYDLEEERRLCYVGLTRAREHLTLSASAERGGSATVPSRFIAEIPPELVTPVDAGPTARRRVRQGEQLELF